MSFSQSLSFGDNTLFQLDMCEGNMNGNSEDVNKNRQNVPKTTNKSSGNVNSKLISVDSKTIRNVSTDETNTVLDVIEESPTEKTNVLGRSIRERLKNASSSKKSEYKSIRRSRSDPITSNSSKRSLSSTHMNGMSEDMNIIFDSTFDYDVVENRPHKKSKIKLDEKFEQDDFDKYVGDIKTPNIRANICETGAKNDSLILLDDSDEFDDVDISEVERLMRTELFEKTENETVSKTHNEPIDDIEWEDSAYFNDLLASQQNEPLGEPNEIEDLLGDVVIHTEHVSMRSCQNEGVEDELESCLLEVSMHLSHVNATIENKAISRIGTQLDTSIFSRSITETINSNDAIREENEVRESAIRMLNNRSIDNLIEWNCTQSIIKAYKKKGIREMFEWQTECLSNPKVCVIITKFCFI